VLWVYYSELRAE